jgi:hypothetical protein
LVSRSGFTSGYLKSQSEMANWGSFVRESELLNEFKVHALDPLLELFPSEKKEWLPRMDSNHE